MLRIHGTLASINTYKLRLFLEFIRTPYELVELDMYAGEHKREPFLLLNPFGQMPALEDGDFSLADSHACLVYLARKYDHSGLWYPDAPESQGRIAEWLSKSANEVHQGPWMKRAKLRRPDAITLADDEIDARCDQILRLMDSHLHRHEWLALDGPTIADVSIFAPVSMLAPSGYDTGKWSAVTDWLDRVRALPNAIDIDGHTFA